MNNQRQLYRKGKLSQERTTQLESVGFKLGTQKKYKHKPWEVSFNELASPLGKASARAQSDLPADGSHEEACNRTCNFECPALLFLPPVQEDLDRNPTPHPPLPQSRKTEHVKWQNSSCK